MDQNDILAGKSQERMNVTIKVAGAEGYGEGDRKFRPPGEERAGYFVAGRRTQPSPDRVWLADISYIPTDEGWLHLAAVKNLATMDRRLVDV